MDSSFTSQMRGVFAVACLACVGLPLPALATEDDPGIWLGFVMTDAFETDSGPGGWRYWFDVQARYSDIGSGINQFVVRPAIGFKPDNNMTAWLGYARIRSRNRVGNVAFENRYWQQVDWTAGRFDGGTLTMRTRLEQRSNSIGNNLGVVLRVMARYARPIGSAGLTSLVLALEPFVDLRETDWRGATGLKQNRATIAVKWQVSDKLALETGYMNQYTWRDGGEDRRDHVATMTLRLQL